MENFRLASEQIAFRPREPRDAGFLRKVYASARADELARTNWSDAQKAAFVEQQFQAQDHAYTQNYPGAAHLIIEANATPAGRLYLHRREREIRIIDIALLPPFRNRGIGAAILQQILAQGAAANCAVTIHVETFNPARRLYERLGFRPASQNEVYILMRWSAPPTVLVAAP